jgi:hypothetical protein
MTQFYHLDRGNLLEEGQTIDLVKYNDILVPSSSELTEKLCLAIKKSNVWPKIIPVPLLV